MAMFRVGQRVVCVDASPAVHLLLGVVRSIALVEGQVYTIATVQAPSRLRVKTESCAVTLRETKESCEGTFFLPVSRGSRFRPAVDIERFRALVEPTSLPKLRELERVG